jgi:hypothetical protein
MPWQRLSYWQLIRIVDKGAMAVYASCCMEAASSGGMYSLVQHAVLVHVMRHLASIVLAMGLLLLCLQAFYTAPCHELRRNFGCIDSDNSTHVSIDPGSLYHSQVKACHGSEG